MRLKPVALFIILALAVSIHQSIAANFDVITFSDGTKCGLLGTAGSPAGKSLSSLKNRYNNPIQTDIKSTVSLVAMLKPGDDLSRFKSSWAAKIRGYVIDVKLGGHSEVCNCGERKPEDRDTHIELALTPNAPENQRIIVEVTPRLRQIMFAQGVDWSTKTLSGNNPANPKGSINHKWVEVTGWMMFDTMHAGEAENTNPGGAGNWRASGWEIHPITSLTVLPNPPPSPSAATIGNSLTTAQKKYGLSLSGHQLSGIKARNAQIFAAFLPTELEHDNQ